MKRIPTLGCMLALTVLTASAAASHNLLFANATLQLSMPADFRIEASWSGHTRLYSGNSEVAAFDEWNLSIRKQMFRQRLTLHAGIYNIFDRRVGYATHPTAYDGSNTIRSGFAARRVSIGISYSFASGKSVANRRAKHSDEETLRRLGGKNDGTTIKNQ